MRMAGLYSTGRPAIGDCIQVFCPRLGLAHPGRAKLSVS